MNQIIRFCKVLALIAFALVVFLIWRRFDDSQAFLTMAFLVVSALAWLLLAGMFVTCHFEKMAIQKKLSQAELGLEEIAAAKIKAYEPKGNYVTMHFRSEGVPAEVWEAKRQTVQSAINYTILGRIEPAPKDWGIITFRARKGRPQTSKGVLDDADL